MKTIEKILKISCECKDQLKLEELTEFQGSLKAREDSDINKIVNSIKKYGIAFPLFVWKQGDINYLIDGHGRYAALQKLDELGYLIPPLPVVYIDCKDEQSARDLLLRLNSQYGKMTKESILEFIGDFEIQTDNFELPCGTISFEEKPEIDFEEVKQSEKELELKEKYEVIINCKTSAEQEEVFYKLTQEGYDVKVSGNN